ncbi:MAG: NADH-quinone oxidoreductase subunit NuoF [Elusimicrobiota bacterium]|jgi:NADH:ubiquinone oxidoreductase subunit F (NADH-binding)/(2Fe-2S) ferredoxin/NAD-dependent dihydropyrimidine dehydrogenase PreA subunit|nr:NADH-quinone oxidoreductase subunit NuoF [Elusimicrobiota bacterium]
MPKTDINQIKNEFIENYKKIKQRVTICGDSGCLAQGSQKVYEAFNEESRKFGVNACVEITSSCYENSTYVVKSGCQGFCTQGPLVNVGGILYTNVKAEDVPEITEKTLVKGEIVERLLYLDPKTKKTCRGIEDIPFYQKQQRILLADCGKINPEDINEYIANGGYQGLMKSLKMGPDGVIAEVKTSGLRGRGGGGFPTGLKWELARKSKGNEKYMICNADEGDPGAYMDRSLLEGNPHTVIEGMIIAGLAIGAGKGIFYIRAEYPLAAKKVQKGIEYCHKLGLLGKNIMGSGFGYDLEIRYGAGAFVCGEETALMASIEGNRGMPRPKPPFPSEKGLWGKPSAINNVETLACIPYILDKGGKWYASMGVEKSAGTKVFAMTGKSKNSGLIEVAMGTTVKDIVYEIGGGPLKGDEVKADQTGGPSGGVINKENKTMPITYESLQKIGSIMGSGGFIVMDETDCMVDIAKFYLDFCVDESCGKCAPCRIGGYQMLDILKKITDGKAELEDLDKLQNVATAMQKASLCGLGQTAPNPVLSTLRYFRNEYEEHINNKHCPTGRCSKLINFNILKEKCVGCGACKRACPVGAIGGEVRSVHSIDLQKCIKCGQCFTACKFNAVRRG